MVSTALQRVLQTKAQEASSRNVSIHRITIRGMPTRPRIVAGLKQDGQYVSSLTAEFPPEMALAQCMLPFVAQTGHRKVPLSEFANLLTEPYIHRRPAVCDGAGLNSTADYSNPKPSALKPLSAALMQHLQGKVLVSDIAHSLSQGNPEHPIADHRHELANIIHQHMRPNCNNPECMAISEGQPFRLRLIQALTGACKDPDTALVPMLEKLRAHRTRPSMAAKQANLPCDAPVEIELLYCSGNWTQAENNEEIMDRLLEQEIEQGWVKVFDRNAQT